MHVFLFGHSVAEEHIPYLRELLQGISAEQFETSIYTPFRDSLKDAVPEVSDLNPLDSIDKTAIDIVITLGGDGTILKAVTLIGERQIPILGTASTLNTQGNLSSNLYDHIVIADSAATAELQDTPEILDVRSVATSPKVFYQTVSDHLPLRARFRSDIDDD